MIFKGKSNREFEAAQPVKLATGEALSYFGLTYAAVCDWNGDGHLDLLALTQEDAKLYPGRADGTFDAAIPVRAAGRDLGAVDATAAVIDWDGDGILDLLLGTDRGGVNFYRGTGKQTGDEALQAPVTYFAPPSTLYQKIAILSRWDEFGAAYPSTGWRTRVTVWDWDGDGRLDLIVGDSRNVVYDATSTAETQSLIETFRPVLERHTANLRIAERGVHDKDPAYSFWNATSLERHHASNEFVLQLSEATLGEEASNDSIQFFQLIQSLTAKQAFKVHMGLWVYLQKPPSP